MDDGGGDDELLSGFGLHRQFTNYTIDMQNLPPGVSNRTLNREICEDHDSEMDAKGECTECNDLSERDLADLANDELNDR